MRTWKVTIRRDGEIEEMYVKASDRHEVPYTVASEMGGYADYVICDWEEVKKYRKF